MATSVRALFVEGHLPDVEAMLERLEREDFDVEWQRVETEPQYRDALDESPELVLADWSLPHLSGLRALEILRERDEAVPFVLVTSAMSEEVAVLALHSGADDYVWKGRLERLGPSARRALERSRQRVRRALTERDQQRARMIFEKGAAGIVLADPDGSIVTVNPAFCEITGYRAEEVVGRNPRILGSGRHSPAFYEAMWHSLASSGHWRGEIWNRRKSGEVYPEWLSITAVRARDGEILNYVGMFSDISAVRDAEEQAQFLANHDALTGLPNRSSFRERLLHALAAAKREGRALSVLHVDLDRFTQVNGTLGHPLGDEIISAWGQRLSASLDPGVTLARLEGDSFGLLLDEVGDAANAIRLARQVVDVNTAPLQVGGRRLTLTSSIGISLFPGDGEDPDTLRQFAERAMHEARDAGGNTYRFFAPALVAGLAEDLALEHSLRGAAARGELVAHYQPIFELQSGRLVACEALVRWRHPELGLLPPARFIEIAEASGIIDEIGAWVLGETCRQLIEWDERGLVLPRAGVNFSARELERDDPAAAVLEVIAHHGVEPERIALEITESMMIRRPEHVLEVLRRLGDQGVRVVLDDFGTGYSSLAHLQRLPIATIKVDRSFVSGIGHDPNAEAICRMVLALSRSLGLRCMAEGVELEGQADFLRREGCMMVQGFLFGRPVSGEEFLSAWG